MRRSGEGRQEEQLSRGYLVEMLVPRSKSLVGSSVVDRMGRGPGEVG